MNEGAELKAARREARQLKKHLRDLSAVVGGFLSCLDQVMTKTESAKRGRAVAEIASALDYANDCARHFGLGEPLGKKVRDPGAFHAALGTVQASRRIVRELEERDAS